MKRREISRKRGFFFDTVKVGEWYTTDDPDKDAPSDIETKYEFKFVRIGATVTSVLVGIPLILATFYITQEGFRGVVRTMGEVTADSEPGLHFKMPIFQTVDMIEVRPRRYSLKLQAATTGKTEDGSVELQMPSVVTITGNWSVDPESVKDIVSRYGSIQQFEDRILDPRVREATLAEFPKHNIETIMTDRVMVSQNIFNDVISRLQGQPVTMTDMMVSNVDWHAKINAAILAKQDAKLKKETEQYKLDKQNLEAQQAVNTAQAKADGIDKVAAAEARAIKLKGEAEASAIKAKANALKTNPGLIALTHQERWDGAYPQWYMSGGETPDLLMQMPTLASR